MPLATLQSYFLPEIKVCLYTTETNVNIKRTLFHFLTSNINGQVSSPPPLQRNIHHKTAKYHLLLALTDGITIINNILIMVRTYKSINQPDSYNASQRPKSISGPKGTPNITWKELTQCFQFQLTAINIIKWRTLYLTALNNIQWDLLPQTEL